VDYCVGSNLLGGLTQKARVTGSHLVRTPAGLDNRTARAIGTAGFAAMLAYAGSSIPTV
jgi:NADPH:quinone reductase-like Zn-dependent oxidoreductase